MPDPHPNVPPPAADGPRRPPPSAPPPPSAAPGALAGLRPTSLAARQPILDALRGGALLGILLVNVHLMRGPDIWQIISGATVPATATADRIATALTGWLVTGKFVSSFALLFGIGAALIARRAVAAGRSPRDVLARRYGWLLLFGLLHMVLLFPGDILFLYGVAGLLLLLFVNARDSVIRGWAFALLAISTVMATLLAVGVALASAPPAGGAVTTRPDPGTGEFVTFVESLGERSVEAFTTGSYLDVIGVNAWQALFVQTSQLLTVPWVLGLFLLGYLVGRAGWVDDLAVHRSSLRRLAVLGLGFGLPLNLPLLASGPMQADGPLADVVAADPLFLGVVTIAQLAGAPLLAVGYLAAAALLFLRVGAPAPLAAVGRMALTGYLLQSVLALIVFAGFSRYGQTSAAASLLIVAGIWVVLLVVCPLWLRAFRFGPVEWLWRTLTYGRGQPLRREPSAVGRG